MQIRTWLWVAVAALSLGAAPVKAACVIGKVAELPVTMSRFQPLVNAKFNGHDIQLMADSGAFYSLISRADAERLGLYMRAAPANVFIEGVGGAADVEITRVETFTLAGVDLHDVEFLVGGTAMNAVGVLGRNVLAFGDTEYDLGEGVIRLLHPRGCGGAALDYWAADKPDTVVPMQWANGQMPAAIIEVKVNGVAIRALMDTGSSTSVLSLAAARRVGIDVNGPNVVRAGVSAGVGQRLVRAWLAPVSTFEVGGEKITNVKIGVIDASAGDHDMLLGADFFLSHRVLISNSQRKVYITYQGGPVFDLAQHPKMAAANQALADIAAPTDADGYSRRGAAYLARGDKDRALADFDKAVELAPKEPRYLMQRAQARISASQPFLAMADLDAALALDPGDLDARLLRATLRRVGHDEAGAVADLDAATRSAPQQSNLRLAFGDLDMGMERYDAAVVQYDLWIQYHSEDARRGQAYDGLCFAGAMIGQDLDRSLSNCNRAVGLRGNSVRPLAARALVRVRRGEFARAIADDDAALKLTDKAPWALYGRGLAELKTGAAQAGHADLDAAAKLSPAIAERARKYGLAPDGGVASTAAASPP